MAVNVHNLPANIITEQQDYFICTVCEKGFKTEPLLAVHLAGVHNHKDTKNRFRKWSCNACPKMFFKPSDRMRHQRTMHKELPQDLGEGLDEQTNDHCDDSQCPDVLESVSQNDGSYTCCMCSKPFDSEESYSLHMIRVHGYEDTKESFTRFPCQFCKIVFYKLSDQKRHEKTHNKPFHMEETSDHAQKGDDSEHAQRGRSEHSNQGEGSQHFKKKGSCEVAQQETEAKSSSVGEHILECPICSKVFKMEKYVTLHLVRVHGQTDKANRFKQFPCSICEKVFFKNSDMVRHVKGCSTKKINKMMKDNKNANKGQQTDLCDSSKSLGNSVNDGGMGETATKEGSSDKTLQCEHCNQIFQNDEFLELHKVDAHGVTGPSENDNSDAEVCKQCGKQFRTHHGLTRHIQKHEGKFKCTMCEHVFGSQNGLDRHMKIHVGTKDHICKLCGKGFIDKHKLRRHSVIHSGYEGRQNSKALICDQCDKHFETRGGLVRHTRQHQRAFKCELCQKVFGSQTDLTRHIKNHVDEANHTCYLCGRGFDKECEFEHHLTKHKQGLFNIKCPNKVENKAGVCEACGKQFATRHGLERHMRQHKGIFKCEVCGKVFGSVSDLGRHNKIHTGQKDHVCDQCGKGFVDKRNLECHKLIHTGEKPHKCPECDKWFRTKSEIRAHIQTKHCIEKNYKCLKCGKAFKSNAGLYCHRYVHDKESFKLLHCTICKYKTPFRLDLQSHMNRHTGNKPFSCKLCDKSFGAAAGLRSHMWSHTGEKKYKCEHCPQAFFRSDHVKRHMMAKHGDELQEGQA